MVNHNYQHQCSSMALSYNLSLLARMKASYIIIDVGPIPEQKTNPPVPMDRFFSEMNSSILNSEEEPLPVAIVFLNITQTKMSRNASKLRPKNIGDDSFFDNIYIICGIIFVIIIAVGACGTVIIEWIRRWRTQNETAQHEILLPSSTSSPAGHRKSSARSVSPRSSLPLRTFETESDNKPTTKAKKIPPSVY